MPTIAGRNPSPFDLGILGGGLLVFIASFLPWWEIKEEGGDDPIGWNIGFEAYFPIFLCLGVAAIVAAETFTQWRVPDFGRIKPALVNLAASGLAVVVILIGWIAQPPSTAKAYSVDELVDEFGADVGVSYGLFIALVGALVVTAGSFMRFQAASASGRPAPGGWPQSAPPPSYPQPTPPPTGYPQAPTGGYPQGAPAGYPQPTPPPGYPQGTPPPGYPQGTPPPGYPQGPAGGYPQGGQQPGYPQPPAGGYQQGASDATVNWGPPQNSPQYGGGGYPQSPA
ncbi:hypothetical protein I6A84_44410 [Frankia sp. CNm7]|uniref:Uncharacterized protein n=1 Tax=Frankia nepalensis TaxID=1836974 RepID=A0A937UNN5_9ACTN|nr:hypothetical protein [Frankia nepalensis]MBL7501746.1 hypothetical protein [Frankia nepalensis]MBL7513539.1 hypothetical protein [Frankia nepalensis]MBL7524895.1 hypothetical protein [Frankia nepalensis]MBL7628172.1 hypothetical protein [Frankia nepalensis]